MSNNLKKSTALGAMGLLTAGALLLAGCAGQGTSAEIAEDCVPVVDGVETVSDGKLTISVAEYPPYVTSAGGELAGVDGEVLLSVAEKLCLVPDYQTQSFTAVIESVKTGNADLTAGNWYINEERQSQFEVSGPVYLDQMAVVSTDGLSSIEELEGLTVGTTQGYLWVADFQQALGQNNVQLYASEDATYQDLRAGRIDAGILTYGSALSLLESNNDESLKVELFEPTDKVEASVNVAQTAVLVEPGNEKLVEAVNLVVEQLREDGTLGEILVKYGLDESAADAQ